MLVLAILVTTVKAIIMSSLLAIDPGSNKLGLAWFVNGKLSFTETLTTTAATPTARRLEVGEKLANYVHSSEIASEEPLLLGRNNNGMQRLLGYIEWITRGKVAFYHPMTVKKFTGSGSSDKLEMALAVGEILETDEEREVLADAINREAYDETDAVCIGLTHLRKNAIES